jgi:hypothetical protein
MTAALRTSSRPYISPRGRRYAPAVGLAGLCLVAAFSPAGSDDGPILCPYRLATGNLCPGCGCTRAVRAVTRGDLAGALTLNSWAVLFVAELFVFTALFAAIPTRTQTWWNTNRDYVILTNAVILILTWASTTLT